MFGVGGLRALIVNMHANAQALQASVQALHGTVQSLQGAVQGLQGTVHEMRNEQQAISANCGARRTNALRPGPVNLMPIVAESPIAGPGLPQVGAWLNIAPILVQPVVGQAHPQLPTSSSMVQTLTAQAITNLAAFYNTEFGIDAATDSVADARQLVQRWMCQ